MTQSQIALRKLAVPQGQDIPTSQCSGFFPLTPALSLGERVNHALRGELATPVRLPPRVARCGEGQGEGKRRGLRSPVSDHSRNRKLGESFGSVGGFRK